ncbi:MAG TPA: hypothetical protein ACFYEH_00670 [Candidatus Brocadiaceae bacterium]
MGAIHVTVTLSWPEAKESFEALFLVDTGATDSMAPGSKSTKAGFKPAIPLKCVSQ